MEGFADTQTISKTHRECAFGRRGEGRVVSRNPLCEPFDISKDATQRGAIVYYEKFSHYRDFEWFREPGRGHGGSHSGDPSRIGKKPPRRSMRLTISRATISRLRFAGRYASEALHVR